MESWSTPLPLIGFKDGKFHINEDTEKKLSQINKPLVVACVVGPYRTGKSYLMNRLAGNRSAFELGNTVESCSKGICVLYVDHPKDENKGLLLMDTEGIEDPMKGDESNDTCILCAALLLSSTFIYNTSGKIDSNILQTLSLITDVTKKILVTPTDNTDANFDGVFPHFILAIRDATLILEMNGQKITDDEYMEKMLLTLKPEETEQEKNRNNVKKKIRRYFPHRKCFYFSRPASDDHALNFLDQISDNQLQEKFRRKCEEFCQYIHESAPVKKICRINAVNGRTFVSMASFYLEELQKGSIPCIQSAYEMIAEKENELALDKSVDLYRKLMFKSMKFPVSIDQLQQTHLKSNQRAIELFLQCTFMSNDEEKYRKELQHRLYNEYRKIAIENEQKSDTHCNEILHTLFQPIKSNIEDGKYNRPTGSFRFNQDLDKMYQIYCFETANIVKAESVGKVFLDKVDLVWIENCVSKEEQKNEREKLAQKSEKRQSEIEDENYETGFKYKELLDLTIKDFLKTVEEHQISAFEKLTEDFQCQLNAREAERVRLREENCNEDAKQQEAEINNLKRDYKKTFEAYAPFIKFTGNVLKYVPNPTASFVGLGMLVATELYEKRCITKK